MKRPSQALIDKWYARLRAEGFRDIERGRDLNETHASTFRGGDGSHGPAVYLSNHVELFERPLSDHPTAIYYREMEHAAHKLKGPRRKLILMAGEMDAAKVARKLGRKRNGTGKLVRRFALEIGLRREVHDG